MSSYYGHDWPDVQVTRQSGAPLEEVWPKRTLPWAEILMLLAAVIANLMVAGRVDVPYIRPVLGSWLILALPTYLLYTNSLWHRCEPEERLAYSLCSVLLALMLGGLVINATLPMAGMQRPLGADKVMLLADLVNLTAYILRRRYPAVPRWRAWLENIGREELRLLVMAGLSVILVVLGANRLNNGAGSEPTLLALAIAIPTILLTLYWIKLLRESIICLVLYLVSASFLLSTSLRGWYVTGHDIQEEYHVFQVTSVNAHWSMAYFQDAYNACLSITILPTELARMVDIDDPYVFKLIFQLIFAVCPVFVYGISRRYFSRRTSVLAVAYFIGFPTFFTDMPFLNRQEIAYLFVSAGTLAITNRSWTRGRREITLLIAAAGVELSHYSSMYVFIGVLALAWLSRYSTALLAKFRLHPAEERRLHSAPTMITLTPIVVLVGIVFLWGGLATGTSGQVLKASQSAIAGLSGDSSGTRSGNVSFSLFAGGSISPSTVLQNYRQKTAPPSAGGPNDPYLPKAAVAAAATPYVAQQASPLTQLGRVLSGVGLPVALSNAAMRNVIAYCEQLFLLIGLLRLIMQRRRQRRPVGLDLFWLSLGSLGMVGLITVLPSISADYGVLRAFQEALIFFCPVVVLGSETIFKRLGKRRGEMASAVVYVALFAYTSGLVPQLVGGNLAELNLNNSGSYYDLYYMRPQDEAAVKWLSSQPYGSSYPIQSSYLQTKYLFATPTTIIGSQAITDDFPTLLLRSSWVILGYPTVGYDLSYAHVNGDLIEYKYPMGLLNNYKNLVYSNGEAQIYK